MKRSYRLVGLDCANCAAKMERAIGKLPEVQEISINFMTTKMTIETPDDKMDSVIERAESIIKGLEPQVVLKRA